VSRARIMERVEASPRFYARIGGVEYVFVIIAGTFAELFVRGRLFVHGDAAATAHDIMAHQMLYRWGFAVEVLYCVCNLPVAVIFYNLFKVVNRKLALLGVCLDIAVNTIEAISTLAHYEPLLLLNGGHH